MSDVKFCPKVGQHVVYHNPYGVAFDAILTEVWGDGKYSVPCVNLVIVSEDKSKADTYGRQIERVTSCSHKSQNAAHGNYWRLSTEEANAGVPAQSRQ